MDAGVPLEAPVAGIAMGLITDEGAEHAAILTDIQGMEDALGDMDFKVAGSETGITALQMDMQDQGPQLGPHGAGARAGARGPPRTSSARCARRSPRRATELSQWAPRIETININPDKIRDVIGPGGKMIRKIVEETGCQIDVEDDGRVFIASANAAAREQAMAMIHDLTDDIEIGRIYKGKVVAPHGLRRLRRDHAEEGRPGAGSASSPSTMSTRSEDVVNVGDEIMVKVIEVDDRGRVNLSRREAIRELVPAAAGSRRQRRRRSRVAVPRVRAGGSGGRRRRCDGGRRGDATARPRGAAIPGRRPARLRERAQRRTARGDAPRRHRGA